MRFMMLKFKTLLGSVSEYRDWQTSIHLERLGFLDEQALSDIEALVKRYAVARHQNKRRLIASQDDFDPFTDDPNCKTCRKAKNKG